MANRSLILKKDIFPRVRQFCETHNVKNTGLAESFRLNRRMALEKLVLHYFYHLQDVQKLNLDTDQEQIMPEYYTSRSKLTKIFGCGEKTAYNYLTFFQDSGVLKKDLHGRQNDFGLTLHPYFFNQAQEMPEIQDLKSRSTDTPKPIFSVELSNFLPPISAKEAKEIDNYYNKAVENVENASLSAFPRFQNFSFDAKEPQKKGLNSEDFVSTTTKGAGAESQKLSTFLPIFSKKLGNLRNPDQMPQDKGPNSESGSNQEAHGVVIDSVALEKQRLEKLTVQLVRQFWAYSKHEFYADYFFNDKAEAKIMQLILDDVFRNFQGVCHSEAMMRDRYIFYINAVLKAKNYAEKNHWVSFLPPLHYFSQKFYQKQLETKQFGSFFYAVEWAKQDHRKLSDAKRMQIVDRAKRAVINEKPPQGRKELTTRMQIAVHYRQKIQKLGMKYLDMYDAFLSNPHNFQ